MNVVCLVCCLLALARVECAMPPACSSDVYCTGELLHTVQMADILADSKSFVDMKMKGSRDETWKAFKDMMERTHNKPSKSDIHDFLNETFDKPGMEFEQCSPADWKPSPKFLDKIQDRTFRSWASHLNNFWKVLCRKMKDEVKTNHEQYSIIYVPNPVIIPGGRFREFYYWDSYWIVRGLLLCEMYSTVRGMLENFMTMVQTYGFVPNGGRIYYTMRSQPPFLIPMVKSYMDATNDTDFLRQYIGVMEKEFDYWMVNHTVQVLKDGSSYTMARYYSPSSGPRPESYKEDYQSAQYFKTEAEKEMFYLEIKTAAESGWDFSSRWFVKNGTDQGNLTDTKAQYIIPVELNSLIYWNAQLLTQFYKDLGMDNKTQRLKDIAERWREAVTKVLWNEEVGSWLDYDNLNSMKRDYFYPTNLAPLWVGCYKREELQIGKIMKYLERTQIMMHLGGIPTSKEFSNEQWDYPNAWPPLQYIVIMALENTGDEWARELAFRISERWIRSNFKTYNESEVMYEKYDATFPGGHGTGGEYVNQIGFGWTNGVILELLDRYGHMVEARDTFFNREHHQKLINAASSLACHTILVLVAVCTAVLW